MADTTEHMTEREEGALHDCLSDILTDSQKYLDEAKEKVKEKCSACDGTGKVPIPEWGTPEGNRQLLSALVKDLGGYSSVDIAGDDCRSCEEGYIYNEHKVLQAATDKVFNDYKKWLRPTKECVG
jgi:hypothetical protein